MDKKRKFSKKALRDFELIDAAIAYNDQNAFSELMSNYKNSIYFTILKMIKDPDDAEDLTIEAFSKAFNKLDKFKKDYTFSTWLFRIATNNTIDFIRKKRLKTTRIVEVIGLQLILLTKLFLLLVVFKSTNSYTS